MKLFKWTLCLTLLCGPHLAFAEDEQPVTEDAVVEEDLYVEEDIYVEDNPHSTNDRHYCSICCDNVCETFMESLGIHFTVFGDLLYWQVSRSDLNYEANEGIDSSENCTKFMNPDYKLGYRVGATLQYGQMGISTRYLAYNRSKKNSFPGKNNRGRYRIDADIVDFELGSTIDLDVAVLRPILGVKFAWIDEKFYKPEQGGDHKLSFDGVGFMVGTETSLKLTERQSLQLRNAFTILDGKFVAKEAGFDDVRKKEFLFVPVHELFIGLETTFTECPFTMKTLVGYEAQSWVTWREFNSFDDIASLGFSGLVGRLTISM